MSGLCGATWLISCHSPALAQGIAGTGRCQLAQNDGRNDRTGFDRSLQAHQFRPLPEDRRRLDLSVPSREWPFRVHWM